MTRRLQRSWPARPEAVSAARRAVAEFAAAAGLPDPVVHDLQLAVSEACTNAVLHGYAGREAGLFSIEVDLAGGEVCLTVRDDGCGMRPRTDSPGLGLGLPLIARVAHAFEIHQPSGGHGTELRMTFRSLPAGAGAAPA